MEKENQATVEQLRDGEKVTKAEREHDVRAAIERIFENGVVPSAVIIYADLGPGSGKLRVSTAGPPTELPGLAVAGGKTLANMLQQIFAARAEREQAPVDPTKMN